MTPSASDVFAEELARGFGDPLRFVLWAFPWGETPEFSIVPLPEPWRSRYPGCEYGPDKWMCELLDEIGEHVKSNNFDGRHSVPPFRKAVASGHGIGKLHPNTLVVDTPQGPRQWGDLRVGDFLFGSDGKPVRIIDIPYEGVRPCYRVTFDDGSSTVVGQEHLWAVRGRQERRKKLPGYRVLETQEILRLGVKRKNGSAMARQWEIPQQAPVEYPEADQPVPAYLIGLYLGNGSICHTGSPHLMISSKDVLDHMWWEFQNEVPCTYYDLRPERNCYEVHIRGIPKEFAATGLKKLRSHERFIPDVYKYASIEQRTALFQGLMDSDGEVTPTGSLVYSTTSPRLRDDVMWLARSLGGKAQLHPTVKKAWYRGENGEKIQGKDCWRITLTMPRGFVCGFYKERVSRLKETVEPRYLTRWIDSIEYVGDLPGKCVSVENADGLYLANDFIATHNSAGTAMLAVWMMATRPNAKGVITANTASQLETKTFAEIKKWLKHSLVRDMFDVKAMSIEARESPESWRLDAITCREENSESFAGQHSASSSSFYIFDEASAVPDVIWEVAEGGLTDGEPFMFVFGNPTRNTGRFRECFGKRKARWSTSQIDSRDVFITNKVELEEWRKEYGEDSDFFRVRVRGLFPSASSMQFIPTALAESAAERELPSNSATAAIIGVDVARYGDDDSVIYVRIGKGYLPIRRYHGLSTTELVARVKQRFNEVRQLGFPRHRIYINVDEGGVGGGPKDILRDDGYPVMGVQFGAGADDRETYARKREEMWGRMKLWLGEGGTIPNDRGLIDDLTSPEYDILPSGQVKLESKKDMKKRGLASPDAADALALTFARRIEEYIPLAELDERRRYGDRRSYDPFSCLKSARG